MTATWKTIFSILATISLTSSEIAIAQDLNQNSLSLHALMGADYLAENVNAVRRKASTLPLGERYRFLSAWVLPSPDHPDFRVTGEFVPTDPSPPVLQSEPYRFPSEHGGEPVSPVFDLLETARATERLDELRRQIAEAVPGNEIQQRAKSALLYLINLEREDFKAAGNESAKLHRLVKQQRPKSVTEMWPETLAVYRGLSRFGSNAEIGDLLSSLYLQRTMRNSPKGIGYWHRHIASLMETYRRLKSEESPQALRSDGIPGDWIITSRLGAEARGDGSPDVRWSRAADNRIDHLSGVDEDYLLFRSPLRGEFEIEGEIGSKGTTQVVAAGKYFGTRENLAVLETGTFRRGSMLQPLATPFSGLDEEVRFRIAFRQGNCTIDLNGLCVYSEPLEEHSDPWIGFRGWSTHGGMLRNVQVTGEPRIPNSIVLSSSTQLVGWGAYHEDSVGREGAMWRYVEDPESTGQIYAWRLQSLSGSFSESLLRYIRPLVEDGSIEYDFFYQSGQVEVHPALDRLAFVLDKAGVRLHWITDGRFDRTELSPDNLTDEPHNRRGPSRLPLEENNWNHLKLSLEGEVVSLELNGEVIYERELERTNRRTFGLFRYADQTEVRVRNMVMSGGWPKELSPVSLQELADHTVTELDKDREHLTAVFTHDFTNDGLPDRFFEQERTDSRSEASSGPEGVVVVRPSDGKWSMHGLKLRFAALGDFDIEASFAGLRTESDQQAAIMLMIQLDDTDQHRCRLSRMQHLKSLQQLNPAVSVLNPDGRITYDGRRMACEAGYGRFRIARRGETVHFLFAENDSNVFRRLRSETVSDRPTILDGISLLTDCNGNGTTRVVWKNVTVRAEGLKYLDPSPAAELRQLYAMKTDGSVRSLLTEPAPGFFHMGSPEWSADGKKIALDMSAGGVEESHIVVVNADGSEFKDLGLGCMPSISHDGKSIVFSQLGAGVMMMDSDGSNRRIVDRAGWGAQFSPDGKRIAYGTYTNFTLVDAETREKTTLLTGDLAERYSSIFWNLGWSHDSRAIAFKGRNRATKREELVVVDVEQPDQLEILSTGPGVLADFTFAPDNKSVLFAKTTPGNPEPQLYIAHRKNPVRIELLKNQPADRVIYDCDWSHDGREIVFTGVPRPVPVEWPIAERSISAGQNSIQP